MRTYTVYKLTNLETGVWSVGCTKDIHAFWDAYGSDKHVLTRYVELTGSKRSVKPWVEHYRLKALLVL